jgi:hypothetical protein
MCSDQGDMNANSDAHHQAIHSDLSTCTKPRAMAFTSHRNAEQCADRTSLLPSVTVGHLAHW